jgi:ubiquitin-activating enzyme E1
MDNMDVQLYSRQLYTIGKNAMKCIMKANIIVSGMTGVGVEVAKCLILYGCNSVILHDTGIVRIKDLSSNYYVSKNDLTKNRAEVVHKKLSQLNSYVKVSIQTEINLDDINVLIVCDQFAQSQIQLNTICRNKGIHFIMASTLGLFGTVFCDFGKNFIINDIDGEELLEGILIDIKYDNDNVICETSTINNLSSNDTIEISNNKEHMIVQITKILNKYTFVINISNEIRSILLSDNISYKQVKQSQTIQFKSLELSIKEPEFTTIISSNDNQEWLHKIFIGIEDYVYLNKKLPENSLDIYMISNMIGLNNIELITQIIKHINIKLSPVDSIIGSIAAQEAIKSISNKYTPIKQWMYYDTSTTLSFDSIIQQKLQQSHVFIVGSGAIGCELLKHLAMLNVGNVIITDMDNIEKSNLNRQFLFRNEHIGMSKSEIAKKSILEMNPNMNITACTTKVSEETVQIYNDKFFEKITCVMNALDNIKTRLFVDDLCVKNEIPLIDSGTLGTKGNVQVIIPHNTESYGSSVDPPEQDIPLCTIKHFPYSIEHTIEWSRNLFEGIFTNAPKNFLKYKQNTNCKNNMTSTDEEELLNDVTFVHSNSVINDIECINFGYKMFVKYFVTNINKICEEYPCNKLNDDGTRFWSGIKKFPNPFCEKDLLQYDDICNFVESCANLWAIVFKLPKIPRTKIATYIIKKINYPIKETKEKKAKFPTSDMIDYDVQFIEFEKDCDTNYHMDFITSASNLRAINYSIKPIDKFETKKIAGKIIPSLATTTSLISALAIIEFIKIVQFGNTSKKYVNTFVNMALPLICSSEPIYVKYNTIGKYNFSMWDKLCISKNPTLQTVFDCINKKVQDNNINNAIVTSDKYMLYSSLTNTDTVKLNQSVFDIFETISNKKISNSLYINVLLMNDNDEDFEPILCQIK